MVRFLGQHGDSVGDERGNEKVFRPSGVTRHQNGWLMGTVEWLIKKEVVQIFQFRTGR